MLFTTMFNQLKFIIFFFVVLYFFGLIIRKTTYGVKKEIERTQIGWVVSLIL